MGWSKLEGSFRNHPKLKRLARGLDVRPAEGRGLMAGLWAWCDQMAPDGDLSDFDAGEIADGADWAGNPELFIDAAAESGLMDIGEDGSRRLHNFLERAESHRKAKQKAALREKKRLEKIAKELAARAAAENRGETVPRQGGDRVETVSLRGEERRGEEQTGDKGEKRLARVPLTLPKTPVSVVSLIFDYWRERHGDEFQTPHGGLREWGAISKRISEDAITPDQLREAIDGILVDYL